MNITKTDLALALYGEITEEISRGDDNLVATKIDVGIGELSSYLNRYDVALMFGAEWQNAHFKQLCVTIITWHLVQLCNPSVSIEVLRTNYEDAIKYLTNVQKGFLRPLWPLRPDDPATAIDDAGNIQFSSNPKRRNHY